jgi:hypothetical protein
MSLVLALGMLGAIQANWSKNLFIQGVIETGDLRGDWKAVLTADACHPYPVTTAIDAPEPKTVPRASISGDPCKPPACDLVTYRTASTGSEGEPCLPPCNDTVPVPLATSSGAATVPAPCNPVPACTGATAGAQAAPGGIGTAVVTLENAAPGYSCRIQGVLTNNGSIPFTIVGANTILDSLNGAGLEFVDLNGTAPGKCTLTGTSGPGPGPAARPSQDQPRLQQASQQVSPGKDAFAECQVRVKEGAEPGYTYYFAIELCVAQWSNTPPSATGTAELTACKTSAQRDGPVTPVLQVPHKTVH